MADLIVVLGVVVFFAIAALFVGACDRIIGPDPAPVPDETRERGDVPVGSTR